MFKPSLASSVCSALLGALALLISTGASTVLAKDEIVELGNGTSVTISEYLIETDNSGYTTLVVRAVPNFDPEPYGQVPSDDYARAVQPLCGNLVANGAATLKREGIDAIRVRWDFTPPKPPEGTPSNVTITRFHEMVFDVADNAPCTPKPLGVGLDNLSPKLSGGIEATLRWAEPGLTPGELSLTYAVTSGLAEISASALDRTAVELCILHADMLMESRARYYKQFSNRTVAITLAQDEDKPGFQLLRRVVFPVRDGHCQTGLSAMLTDAIRNR